MGESPISPAVRQIVFERARGCCEYCRSQARFAMQPFSIEHIVPRAQRGTEQLSNLALSCQGCNGSKYTHTEAIDPVTGETVPLFNPRSHAWAGRHMPWS